MIYGHGDDSYRYGDKIRIDFSSNVYRKTDHSELKEHLMRHFDVIKRYPEPEPRELEQMLAQKLGISAGRIMVTSGVTDAIYLLAQHYQGWASVIPQPTFNEYTDACKLFGHIISYDSNDELEQLPQHRLYWLCNPNNPTGNTLLKTLVRYIITRQDKYIYILDQSYEDYTLSNMIRPKETVDLHNVITLHSMSKKYCVPGLRLGYITASPIIIERLRRLRQPWAVGALEIEAGKYLTEHNTKAIPNLKEYLEEAARLHAELAATDGLMVMHSDTNFMLVNIDIGESQELKHFLIDRYGILIRDASNFHGLDNHCFRIAAQQPEENNELVSAIKDYIEWRRNR